MHFRAKRARWNSRALLSSEENLLRGLSIFATDAYIAMNEQMQAETQGCISNGGMPYDCVMQVGISGMSGAYPGVVERAQNAALQSREESSIG